MKKKALVALLAVLLLGVAIAVFWQAALAPIYAVTPNVLALAGSDRWQALERFQGDAPQSLVASGFVEADTIAVAAEIEGRIRYILVDEGDAVVPGRFLAILDNTLLAAKRGEAEAALQTAQASLDLLKAGARPDAIAEAEARLAYAMATRDGAQQAYLDAQIARDNQQWLETQIVEALAILDASAADVNAASANSLAAQIQYDFLGSQVSDARLAVNEGVVVRAGIPGGGTVTRRVYQGESILQIPNYQWNLSGQDLSVAYERLNAARSGQDAAQAVLNDLLAIRQNPLEANAAVDAALGDLEVAEAMVESAQAQVALVRAGATNDQVQAATAQVIQAQAAVDALGVLMRRTVLTASADSVVVMRVADEGEMAFPGSVILELADLRKLELTAYVPEARLAEVTLGQRVDVQVDGFPGRKFAGRVIYIAPQTQFTPANVQMQDERARNVVAVKVALANPDLLLKPGMPASAWFQ